MRKEESKQRCVIESAIKEAVVSDQTPLKAIMGGNVEPMPEKERKGDVACFSPLVIQELPKRHTLFPNFGKHTRECQVVPSR